MSLAAHRPLIAHIVFCFDYGGLENGVVNVINGLPEEAFRHTVIALTTASDFRTRIRRPDVTIECIGKKPGKDPAAYVRLFKLLKALRPDIAHTRNLSTLEGAMIARLAGVPYRIHGEHGWDVFDPDGTNRKYRALRRFVSPAINQFVVVSRELETWLTGTVGIDARKIGRICNGVDVERFRPAVPGTAHSLLPADVFAPGTVAVGTVTRFSPIKDPLNLVRAFIAARGKPGGEVLRLAMIGDGSLREQAQQLLQDKGHADAAWLPGSRDDIPEVLRELDVFVLGSLREGISNTLLEAMAASLPLVATATGGNLELVQPDVNGRLVKPDDAQDMAEALVFYARNGAARVAHGRAGRERVLREYSLRTMLAGYETLYRAHEVKLREAI